MDILTSFQEIKQQIESLSVESARNDLLYELEDYENLLSEYVNRIDNDFQKYKNYEMLFENAADSIFVYTGEGKILAVNETTCLNYQYERSELLDMTFWEISAPEQTKYIKKKIELLIKTGHATFATRHRIKDGSIIYVDIKAQKTTWFGQQAIISICRDITKRIKDEQAIIENEIKLREIIQQTNDGIVVFNRQKKVVIWNKGAEKVFGVPAKDVINKSILDHQYKFVPPHLKDKVLLDKLISGIINFETPEIFYQIRDEEVVGPDFYKIIETVVFPIKLHDYNLYGAVFRDVTEKKSNEKQILQLNANKDRFLQLLAHDLRSPFNALLGFSNLLLSNLHIYDMQTIENQITIIQKITQKTYDLLEDLLLWSKSQTGMLKFYPQEIVLQEICTELIDVFKGSISSKKISIKFFGEKRTIITADINMIKTVLRNLITNAIKFTNTGGAINIYTERNDEFLIVAVSDNGVGISKETQLELWDLATPHTTKGTENEPGTGLGLIICKELVEKHRGTIWLESEPGKGSTFKFSLPLIS